MGTTIATRFLSQETIEKVDTQRPKKEKRDQKVTLFTTGSLLSQLRERSEATGISVNSLINAAVIQYLKTQN